MALKKDIQNYNTLTQFNKNCFRKKEFKTVGFFFFSSTVNPVRLFIGEKEWKNAPQFSSHYLDETKNVQPVTSSPLLSTLPTRPPVSGEYGRLDSPWRVRSHLETPGQPKAGTVTITRPQSLLWEELVKAGLDRKSRWAEAEGDMGHYEWPVMSQRV